MALTVLLGGARSGKSALAVQIGRVWGGPVVVIATAEARDEEMSARIRRHREARPADWDTIEAPVDLQGALEQVPGDACAIIDCLSLWVSNLLERDLPDSEIESRTRHAATLAAARSARTIVVGNEVGLGLVPDTALGRRYRDVLGRVNTIWTDAAAEAVFVVAGRALTLHDPQTTLGSLDDR